MSYAEFEKQAFDGINLYFQVWQPKEKPKAVICLVHGLGEHAGRYSHWAKLFIQADYAFLAYDLRGHGKSGGKRGHVSSFEDYLKDTDILLMEAEIRFPDIPRFLYGHSLGALIVTNYVLHRKPKLNGVVVSSLSNRTSLGEQKFKVLLSKVLGTVVPKMTISTGLIPATISSDPEVVRRYINDPLVHDKVTVGWGKSALNSIEWSEQHAAEWDLPVLFIHGELDKLSFVEGSRVFSSKIGGDCTLKTWPGLLHEVHNEPQKELVFNFVRDWLDDHRGIKVDGLTGQR